MSNEGAAVEADELEEQRQRRAVSGALDALVRSAKTSSEGTVSMIADRLCTMWQERDDVTVGVEALSLTVDGKPATVAEEDDASWFLPTFMAGLRSVRPFEEAGSDDYMRLAKRIGETRATAQSIEALRDWFWSDGAEGFEVKLASSLVELLEAAALGAELERLPMALRGLSGGLLDATAIAATADLNAASMRAEFVVPLEAFSAARAKQGSLIGEEDIGRYREAIEDPASWLEAEIRVALTTPEIREAIEPSGLARRILNRLAGGVDSSMLALLADMQSADDPYARALREAMEGHDLGNRVARGAVLHDAATCEAVARFGKASEHQTAGSLARGLLQRAGNHPKMYPAVRKTFESWGAAEALGHIDSAVLDKADATAMTRLLVDAETPGHKLSELMAALKPASAAAALEAVPIRLSSSMRERLADLLVCDDNNVVRVAMKRLDEWQLSDGASLVADALEKTQGKNLVPSILAESLRSVVVGGGGERLVGWVKSARMTPRFRIAALEALDPQPEMRARAAKWRVSELLEHPGLQAALKDARAEGKKK